MRSATSWAIYITGKTPYIHLDVFVLKVKGLSKRQELETELGEPVVVLRTCSQTSIPMMGSCAGMKP